MTSEERKAKRAAKQVFGMVVVEKECVFLIGKGILCHGPIFKENVEGLAARARAKIMDVLHYPEHDAFVATEDNAPVAKARYKITFDTEAARAAWVNAEIAGPARLGPDLDVMTHEVWWSDTTAGSGLDGVARELEDAPAPKAKAKAKAKR